LSAKTLITVEQFGEVQVHTKQGIRVLQQGDVLETPILPGFTVAVADFRMNI
jgi:hypothetical protein